jgi:hypothetical protein
MTITTEEAELLAQTHDLARSTLGMKAPEHDLTSAALRDLAAERDALRAENARLREALQTARRDALEEAAQEMDCACPQRGAVLEKLAKDGPLSHHWPCEKSDDCCALRGAAIRALAKGEGDD